MVVLSYRGKTLEVSDQVIKTFEEMEITGEAEVKEHMQETKTTKEGFVTVTGTKAESLSFEVLMKRAAGVDVWEEIKGWRKLMDGKGARVYIAGADILGFDMVLTECPASQIQISGSGVISQAKLKLTFQRNGVVKKKHKKKTSDLNWEAVNRYAQFTNSAYQNGKTASGQESWFASVFKPKPEN